MQNLQTIKAGYFIVLFMMVMFLPVNGFSAMQQADNWLDEPVTVRFQNEPLSKVLEKVSQQTGIAILYDQELANEKVSGNYKDVKASDTITRLFSGKNKSIQVSKDKKVVVVKTFGAKRFIWAGETKDANSRKQNSDPMTLAELQKLHAQQYKEFKERIVKENEVIEGGMTRGEIKALHVQQDKEFNNLIVSDSKFLDSNMTLEEIKIMHEQQDAAFGKLNGNNSTVLGGVITAGEIKMFHKAQDRQFQLNMKNEGQTFDGGISRAEINALHEKQDREFEQMKISPNFGE